MGTKVTLNQTITDQIATDRSFAKRIGLSEKALSNITSGKIRAVRFSTLEIICDELDCDPGDILERVTK